MDICKSCLEFQVCNNLLEPEICPECGHKAFVWKKDEDGCFYAQCLSCLMIMAVDLNTPCEEDSRFRKDISLEVKPQELNVPNIELMKLSKMLRISAMQTRDAIRNGYITKVALYEMDEIIQLLDQNGISYITDKTFEPMKEYGFYKK